MAGPFLFMKLGPKREAGRKANSPEAGKVAERGGYAPSLFERLAIVSTTWMKTSWIQAISAMSTAFIVPGFQ
jgi:hypothetical protein